MPPKRLDEWAVVQRYRTDAHDRGTDSEAVNKIAFPGGPPPRLSRVYGVARRAEDIMLMKPGEMTWP
jgi:hypothetical protein